MAKTFDELAARTMSKADRQWAKRRANQLVGQMMLAEIRKAKNMSQNALAKAMGIKQPSLSKLEKQSDMQVSTLTKLVDHLGGKLRITAKFNNREVNILNFGLVRAKAFKPAAPAFKPPKAPRMVVPEESRARGVHASH